jgi:DNA polymerase-3 subunit epsilon
MAVAGHAVTSALEAEHLRYFTETWANDAPIESLRFVALDTETTGLDPRTDRLITIGALAVRGGQILLEDAFEAMLRVSHNTSAVTVHGVTRDEARDGMGEPEAIAALLQYLRDGVVVGQHIGHDIAMLGSACERHYGFRIRNRSLDTMDLALHLERDGVLLSPETQDFSLDALCARFGVVPHDRHTAPGDAFLTAQVFQRLFRLAARSGRDRLHLLCEPFVDPGNA